MFFSNECKGWRTWCLSSFSSSSYYNSRCCYPDHSASHVQHPPSQCPFSLRPEMKASTSSRGYNLNLRSQHIP
ncbi:hypothetical protein PVAP13_3KG317162 [Panicum virgatum]|uniref:Uncharacterized protein n=1 Tax=Panicum virgatum TaxID=38727 RepID=A0A8T0UQ72_PANVG|nr:hypothetical protein PVAP13_3KG317162 [Panicum virgatum]